MFSIYAGALLASGLEGPHAFGDAEVQTVECSDAHIHILSQPYLCLVRSVLVLFLSRYIPHHNPTLLTSLSLPPTPSHQVRHVLINDIGVSESIEQDGAVATANNRMEFLLDRAEARLRDVVLCSWYILVLSVCSSCMLFLLFCCYIKLSE